MIDVKKDGKVDLLIIVLAYNRPHSLRRLLESLGRVQVPVDVFAKIDLLVHIDGGGDPVCLSISNRFEWHHGRYEVLARETNLGLQHSVEYSTDRVADYDAALVLEDDLSVSPVILDYIAQTYAVYSDDEEVTEIACYSPRFNEFSWTTHHPLQLDEADVYLSQLACSWGQLFTRRAWQAYRKFQAEELCEEHFDLIPPSAREWRHSWKKNLYAYLAVKEKYVIYPRYSLTTNHGDCGQHFDRIAPELSSSMVINKRQWKLPPVFDIKTRFDSYGEYLPEVFSDALPQGIVHDDLCVDLLDMKRLDDMNSSYLLSSKVSVNPDCVWRVTHPSPGESVLLGDKLEEDHSNVKGLIYYLARKETFLSESNCDQKSFWCRFYPSTITKQPVVVELERKLEAYRNSLSFRVGHCILWPLKGLIRMLGIINNSDN